MSFERSFGWTEAKLAASVTSGTRQEIVPAKARHRIVIRRIRGNVKTSNLVLYSGTTGAGATALALPKISTQDNLDIPGLRFACPTGHSLYVDMDANGTVDITIQYGYFLAEHDLKNQ